MANKIEALNSPKYDSDLPSFQEMIYQKESSEFFQVFLSNKLSKQVQEAIKDQHVALGEQDFPIQFELLK